MRRQQILVLWLAESALDSEVVAWAFHDGSRGAGRPLPGAGGPPSGAGGPRASSGDRVTGDDPPYPSGVAALEDGWWLLQAPHVPPPVPGREADPGYLQYEFVFERAVEVQAG